MITLYNNSQGEETVFIATGSGGNLNEMHGKELFIRLLCMSLILIFTCHLLGGSEIEQPCWKHLVLAGASE